MSSILAAPAVAKAAALQLAEEASPPKRTAEPVRAAGSWHNSPFAEPG